MKVKRIGKVLIIILLLIFGYRFFKFVQSKQEAKKMKVVEKVVPVRVISVISEKVEDSLNFVAELHGINEVNVFAKVGGKFLKKVAIEGAMVKEGDVIALIDRDEPAMDYKEVEVKAPISGQLTNYYVDSGETINPQIPLAMLADTSRVKVIVNIGEKDISAVKINDRAKIAVDSFPGKEFSGGVTRVQSKVDPQTRTVEINIEIDNKSGLLKTGMFGKGKIIKKSYAAMVVPLESVLKEANQDTVYVTDGQTAFKRKVTTGLIQDSQIEIKNGLKTGEQIVIEGQDNLQDGVKVEVVK